MSKQNDFFKSITQPESKQVEQTPSSKQEEYVQAMKQLIGLTVGEYGDTLVDDLDQLIKKGIHNGTDGYIHCLSRLMRHDAAWEVIVEAYQKNDSKPPSKYAVIFGRDSGGNKIITTKGSTTWRAGL